MGFEEVKPKEKTEKTEKRKPNDIVEIARRKGLTPAELGRIAGSKPKKKRKAFILTKRRKCNSKCPLYDRCIFQPLSQNFNGYCALAMNDDIAIRTKQRYIRILTGGENEFIKNMKDLLAELDLKTRASKDHNQMRKLLYDYMNTFKTLFGVKQNIKAKVEQDLTINDVEDKIKELIENEDNKKED